MVLCCTPVCLFPGDQFLQCCTFTVCCIKTIPIKDNQARYANNFNAIKLQEKKIKIILHVYIHLFLKSQLFCEQISLKLFVFVAFSLKFVTGSMFKSG